MLLLEKQQLQFYQEPVFSREASGTSSSSAATTPSVSTPVTGHKRMIIPNQPPLTATKKSSAKGPGQPAPIPVTPVGTLKPQPVPASYATASTPSRPAFNVQVMVLLEDAALQWVEIASLASAGNHSGYPSSGPASSTPAFRPEDELEHLTKKMLYDMENPPSDDYFGSGVTCGVTILGKSLTDRQIKIF
ncbi:hypothetical protein TURU_086603 [Turdus rufiventris]|nr:hypothetical protein TURU_086603 [Turdus rufiventris]